MTAQDLIDTLLDLTEGDVDAAIAALEDGQALLALGVTDQDLVEEAYDIFSFALFISSVGGRQFERETEKRLQKLEVLNNEGKDNGQ